MIWWALRGPLSYPSAPHVLGRSSSLGLGSNIYPKLSALFDESQRPENYRLQSAVEGFAKQAIHRVKSCLRSRQETDGSSVISWVRRTSWR